ncbi:cytochrome P450 26C1 [Gracilinanus agilis]|uniref:cytochrome P450 26C1 n=1 Tax=Gracilinanus agilis TaxID=191870 RepID=UPI001CFEE70F|nr:cytochrome P450 26C1 [Gracilinanus agilis]
MFPLEMNSLSVAEAALTTILSLGLLLSVAQHLWTWRWTLSRDRACALPLPKGSMGWPFFGETLHWLVQGSRFHSSRRERYGTVFKTHLLGKPLIRVSGAQNVRTLLLGEHRLVSSQWPQSARILLGSHTLLGAVGEPHRQRRKILARVFSRAALESYMPRIQATLRRELWTWCGVPGPISVYSAAKALTFRIATRILLGLRLEESECNELAKTFEQLMENLFSLPLDVPFSGLRKGIRARDLLHEHMEKAILEKLQRSEPGGQKDALDFIINSAREQGWELTMQELKESAIELIFAAFFTTASATTSLLLLLLKYPSSIEKIRQELASHELTRQCFCWPPLGLPDFPRLEKALHSEEPPGSPGSQQPSLSREEEKRRTPGGRLEVGGKTSSALQPPPVPAAAGSKEKTSPGNGCLNPKPRGADSERSCPGLEASRGPECECETDLTLETLSRLHYLDCVIKEVLRLLPPVSGGYRTALQTFELDGYQIPKGWSVMYSIRDTHETAAIYRSPPEGFDPERFSSAWEEHHRAAGRFHYIPFGGGVRSCIGQELAQAILKLFAVELVRSVRWELATASFPDMQTVPIVHPVDGLQVFFYPLPPSCGQELVSF